MPESHEPSGRRPEGPLYLSCNHFDPPKTKSPVPGRGGLHRGLITGLVSVTMACVGYLLAGLPPRPQGARRGQLRSAYDTFFAPVRAVLHTTRLCTGYARLGKAVCDVAHTASPR